MKDKWSDSFLAVTATGGMNSHFSGSYEPLTLRYMEFQIFYMAGHCFYPGETLKTNNTCTLQSPTKTN